MLAQVISGAVLGVEAYTVRVEVDLARGLPAMSVVGLPQSAVREGRERVTAAILNSGYELPPRKVTINLAPADVRKEGSAFDLPIAIGLLAGSGAVRRERLDGTCFVGELGLDGTLRPVRGVLPLAMHCKALRLRELIVPVDNIKEAAVIDGIEVRGARRLAAVVDHLRGRGTLQAAPPDPGPIDTPDATGDAPDFTDVHGQEHAKRALEIAAAGSHNLLLVGPPGSGKSMMSRRLPSILPPLSLEESLEASTIHSVAGQIPAGQARITTRPFRAPHHTVSDAGLIGGGSVPRPGEASLAHHGVLFLDELPEFRRSALESLRQPLEDARIHLGRARFTVTYPARFMLAASMNPCPCGFAGTGTGRCVCSPIQVQRYMARISGPLLDRIDMHVEVPALDAHELAGRGTGESSARIRERVLTARERQRARFRGRPDLFANAHMRARDVRLACGIDARSESLLRSAIQRLGLSARAYHRILKLARTLADLEGTDRIAAPHIAEAVQYRSLDRSRPAALA